MTRKYKVIYDEKHEYYKAFPDITIPDLFIYHLCGEQAFNDKSPEYLDKIKKIYEKSKYETGLAMKIIEELLEYTLHELREALPEMMD